MHSPARAHGPPTFEKQATELGVECPSPQHLLYMSLQSMESCAYATIKRVIQRKSGSRNDFAIKVVVRCEHCYQGKYLGFFSPSPLTLDQPHVFESISMGLGRRAWEILLLEFGIAATSTATVRRSIGTGVQSTCRLVSRNDPSGLR